MAEVSSYGQFQEFVDVFEEANFPMENVNEPLVAEEQKQLKSKMENFLRSGPFGVFFQTLERANHPLMESSESLISLASRCNSLASVSSMGSIGSEKGAQFTAENVFNAMQAISLNNYESTNSLAGLDDTRDGKARMVPALVRFFAEVFDEFMHNHTPLEDGTSNEPNNTDNSYQFPKMC